jgi:hypothetical protein
MYNTSFFSLVLCREMNPFYTPVGILSSLINYLYHRIVPF